MMTDNAGTATDASALSWGESSFTSRFTLLPAARNGRHPAGCLSHPDGLSAGCRCHRRKNNLQGSPSILKRALHRAIISNRPQEMPPFFTIGGHDITPVT